MHTQDAEGTIDGETSLGAAAKQRRLDTKKIRAKTKAGRGKLRNVE